MIKHLVMDGERGPVSQSGTLVGQARCRSLEYFVYQGAVEPARKPAESSASDGRLHAASEAFRLPTQVASLKARCGMSDRFRFLLGNRMNTAGDDARSPQVKSAYTSYGREGILCSFW